MNAPDAATHIVTGYDKRGNLLYQTWHIGKSSADIELSVWKTRIARRDDAAASATMLDRNTGEVISA